MNLLIENLENITNAIHNSVLENKFKIGQYKIQIFEIGKPMKIRKISKTSIFIDNNYIIYTTSEKDNFFTALLISIMDYQYNLDKIIDYQINKISYCLSSEKLTFQKFEEIIKNNTAIEIEIKYKSEKHAINACKSIYYEINEEITENESIEKAFYQAQKENY